MIIVIEEGKRYFLYCKRWWIKNVKTQQPDLQVVRHWNWGVPAMVVMVCSPVFVMSTLRQSVTACPNNNPELFFIYFSLLISAFADVASDSWKNVSIFLWIIFGLRVQCNDEPLGMPIKGVAIPSDPFSVRFDNWSPHNTAYSLSTWFAVGTLGWTFRGHHSAQ